MSEQTSNPTSGQNVPESKFRRKSRQEQTAASKLRMERRGEKLDAAREKLAKQKPPKKPGAVKRLAHTTGHGVHGFVHGKLYEVEHENVGTEGAHRSELAAESVYRFGRRKLRKAIREHPARAVERAESKHIKATADYYYRKTVEEHPEMDKNQGYEIIKAVMLENGRGFALGHNPAAPSPYVTWACYDDKDGQRRYEWGHYGSDRAALEQDFAARVQEYQRLYNVGVKQSEAPGLYKYYSTQRPVDIGTFPKPPRNAPDEIVNYDQRVPVENGSFLAWGHLTYTRPLTKRQASDYELRPAPDNPDRPRSIREQMKTAAKQAEADRGQSAPKKNAPDRGDR